MTLGWLGDKDKTERRKAREELRGAAAALRSYRCKVAEQQVALRMRKSF